MKRKERAIDPGQLNGDLSSVAVKPLRAYPRFVHGAAILDKLRSGGQKVDKPVTDCALSRKLYAESTLGQDMAGQIATVDHTDMRGLVTDLTSLRRGAGLSLVSGITDREGSNEDIQRVDAGVVRTRVLHTGPTLP